MKYYKDNDGNYHAGEAVYSTLLDLLRDLPTYRDEHYSDGECLDEWEYVIGMIERNK